MIQKLALCTGINNYPGSGNDLQGCLNDAGDASAKLMSLFGYDFEIMADERVTRPNMENKIIHLSEIAKDNDHVVIGYSGHGTYGVDENHDEEDGYDEALYLYDGVWYDDRIRGLLNLFRPKVHLVCIFDSCFSDTVSDLNVMKSRSLVYAKSKFVKTYFPPLGIIRRKPFLSNFRRASGGEVGIYACSDNESAYDAYINGRYNGAFSFHFWRAVESGVTYQNLSDKISEKLPSYQYPQTPHFRSLDLSQTAFDSPVSTDIPDIPPTPDPVPEVEPLTFFQKLWWWIRKILGL